MSYNGTSEDSRWRIHLCALDGSFPAGSGPVINASKKEFTYTLDAGRQMSWTMTLDNPRTPYVLNYDCLAKVYRKNRLGQWKLMMVGDLVSMEETAQGEMGSLACVAADPFWRLNQRWLGYSTNAAGQGVGYQYPATGTADLSSIIQDIMSVTNTEANTGIAIGTVQMTGQKNVLGPVYVQQVGSTIQSLCAISGGPDFELVPHEPSGAWPNTTIATMNVMTHVGLLQNPPPAVFEYGMGKLTVAAYDRVITKSNIANRVISLPQGFPSLSAADDVIAISNDTTSQGKRGLYVYVDDSGLSSLSLRQQLAAQDLSILSVPQQMLSLTVAQGCPLDYSLDYNVGDVATARAYDRQTNTIRFNGSIRIYGIDIPIDDNDMEAVTLTLTPDAVSGTSFPNVPSGF